MVSLAAALRVLPWAVLAAFVVWAGLTYRSAQHAAQAATARVQWLEWIAEGQRAKQAALESQLAEERKAADDIAATARRQAQQLAAAKADRDRVHADPTVTSWAATRQPDLVYARRLQRRAAKAGAGGGGLPDPAGGVSGALPMAASTGADQRRSRRRR